VEVEMIIVIYDKDASFEVNTEFQPDLSIGPWAAESLLAADTNRIGGEYFRWSILQLTMTSLKVESPSLGSAGN
jgi:hypothetical protein